MPADLVGDGNLYMLEVAGDSMAERRILRIRHGSDGARETIPPRQPRCTRPEDAVKFLLSGCVVVPPLRKENDNP
jgi:hypothetical protein